ncbi:MAG: hypothetical protein QGH93_04840 [Gammaproteobacteria bacterium]|jgi:hypothetical protein|nr:hypothetical protein [Chromatiales bacterium]MDP6674163.1 hypothetical protein [Gammaproteobacteria bacterium]
MHPKQVELLASRLSEHRRTKVNSAKAITHIEAAHTKLIRLQTLRRKMKVELAHCIDERDTALREVELLSVELHKHKTSETQ